ncbi:MAG TPA: FKBP-type peptidyl-prolyl cis-trans isomerase [Gammaproteobacteria bacterium]|jgi:FKBP-type peptidyl-prolyl cis-trans isomerase FklB|nr:FKBP-type peptidyl-prolyl cis-trans isomerase [Gammaproteobacteria bacterium]
MKKLIFIAGLLSLLSTPLYADTASTDQQTPAAKNKLAGDNFLQMNKSKPGVQTLPDGLQYQEITPGTGNPPNDNDVVTVDYQGTLIDGTEFDSSYKRGQPATFPVKGVIPGWTEVLKQMKPGATWMVYIPAALAYGEMGSPPAIGPNETLIFKIHLIEVKKN